MKKQHSIFIFSFIIMGFIIISSCKKKDDSTTTNTTPTTTPTVTINSLPQFTGPSANRRVQLFPGFNAVHLRVPLSLTLFNFPRRAIAESAAGCFRSIRLSTEWTIGHSYVLQTSTNLVIWSSVSTNLPSSASIDFTNAIPPATVAQYWRAVWQP